MDLYLKLIDVIVPVFALIGIGYYLGKENPNYDTSFITNFAAKFGSPGIAFYAITSTGISFNLFINYFVYTLLAILGFSIIGIIVLKIQKKKLYYRVTTVNSSKLWKHGFANLLICIWPTWFRSGFSDICCCDNFTFYFRYIFSK